MAAPARSSEDSVDRLQRRLRAAEAAQEAAESALRESEERYRAVVGNSLDAIFLTRPDGTIDEANPAASEMFGYTLEDFRRLGRQGVIDPGSPGLEELLAERRRRGRARGELVMIRSDGSRFHTEVSSNIFRDARGEERTSTMVRDITRRRAAQEREAAARAELERANRLKSEFISVVNHEFRTALTGIQGFSELLRERELTPGQVREYAGEINAEARRLVRMVSEMLDLDRLESGLVKMDRRPCDLNELITRAVSRAQAASRQHQFVLGLDPELPELDLDADKITQVLSNLLGNALKYAPAPSRVDVSTRRAGGWVEAAVRDHGPGIPEAALETVFERFRRLEDRSGDVEGSGLGLPIAREIVQLHGGRLWAENARDGGAVFRMRLPLKSGD